MHSHRCAQKLPALYLSMFLFHGPDIDHEFSAWSQDPGQLTDRSSPSLGRRKVMNNSNRNNSIKTRIPIRQVEVVTDHTIVSCLTGNLNQLWAEI